MPIHLRAEPGDYAEACLLPGDPLRAKYIADTYFNGARVAKLSPTFPGVVSDTAQVAILIGNDYRANC